MKSETLTLVLVNLAGIMERADESLLPGVYKEVGAALHIDPTGLGSLTLFRSIVQSLCYPLPTYLAVRHNCDHVIALGAFLWALATFLVGISSTFFEFEKWGCCLVEENSKKCQWVLLDSQMMVGWVDHLKKTNSLLGA
ncbi:hypothetical protein MKW92_042259 [Papaver armeniacum]|nr:hypothetical protein MKW92_042259 [Papaver armeniacum]